MARAKKTKVIEEVIPPVEKSAEEIAAENKALRDKVILEIDAVLGQVKNPDLLSNIVNDTMFIFAQHLYLTKGPKFLPTMVGHLVKVCHDMTDLRLKKEFDRAGQ